MFSENQADLMVSGIRTVVVKSDGRHAWNSSARRESQSVRVESQRVRVESQSVRVEFRSMRAKSRSVRVKSRSVRVESRSVRVESGSVLVESRSVPMESRSVPVESRSVPVESADSTPAGRGPFSLGRRQLQSRESAHTPGDLLQPGDACTGVANLSSGPASQLV